MGLWAEQAVTATGLNGLAQGRFVGVSVGSPSSGTFSVGDFVVTPNGNIHVCTVSGSPGTWVTPSMLSDAITTGEETMSRRYTGISGASSSSGITYFTYFTARKTETTTQVRVSTHTTAAATVTIARVGLYSVDSSGAGTLVASTANDTTLFTAANTAYTRSWSSSYGKVAGNRYALAVFVSATTAPSYMGLALTTPGSVEYGISTRLSGRLTGQSDLTASFADASLGSSAVAVYGAILP